MRSDFSLNNDNNNNNNNHGVMRVMCVYITFTIISIRLPFLLN